MVPLETVGMFTAEMTYNGSTIRENMFVHILTGNTYYTSFNLKFAYNHIIVSEVNQQKNAFISPLGLYL